MRFQPQNQFTSAKSIHKVGCLTVPKNERSFFLKKIKMRAKSISALLIWRLLNGPLFPYDLQAARTPPPCASRNGPARHEHKILGVLWQGSCKALRSQRQQRQKRQRRRRVLLGLFILYTQASKHRAPSKGPPSPPPCALILLLYFSPALREAAS